MFRTKIKLYAKANLNWHRLLLKHIKHKRSINNETIYPYITRR